MVYRSKTTSKRSDGRIKILLIEDNPGDCRLVQEMLVAEKPRIPIKVECVSRLSVGIDRLAKGGIDAVLLDLGLPDSQGLNTFEKVQAAAYKVPILIFTALANDALALEAVSRGAQDYVVKGKFDGELVIRAITYAIERKRLEDAVIRQAELIDLTPDGVIVRKLDGTINFWSAGAEKMYGWTKLEAIGKRIDPLLQTVLPKPLESINAELEQKGYWSGELIHRTKNRRKVVVQSRWLAKPNEKGEVSEILESNVDITEKKQMQEELKDAERMATIGQTASMVGHDIRNPLQAIDSVVFLLRSDLDLMPEGEAKENMKESLGIIEKNIDYINKIVQDLQDYSRPIALDVQKIDFEGLCKEVLFMHGVPKNIDASYQVEEETKKMFADSAMLKRILSNLVNNAVQAMPRGGKLDIHAYHKAGNTIIEVKDSGPGIPKDIQHKLFTPLFTTKSKGQGFGLVVCKRLVEAQGGTITFETENGKGTKFIIKLPIEVANHGKGSR